MPAVPPSLLHAIPAAVREAFATIYPDVPESPEALRAKLDQHLAETDAAATRNEFVDLHLSRVIAGRLRDALTTWDTLDPDARRILHAAIAYYALREDAEDDIGSVLGFEDDAQVANACLRALGRPDLEIDLE